MSLFGWHLSRINQGYQMTRIDWPTNSIECRELNWIERLFLREIIFINCVFNLIKLGLMEEKV